MDRIYNVIPERCIACGKCELACAFAHGSEGRPAATRIHIHRRGPDLGTPVVCLQCDDPSCLAVCPVGALTWNAATAAIEVSRETCIRCRMCVAACPFGNMIWDDARHEAAKCDLCGGDPKCVPFCPTQALEYVPADRAADLPRAYEPGTLR
jgi:Fe-S-cluster-containing hydrogenase component 2